MGEYLTHHSAGLSLAFQQWIYVFYRTHSTQICTNRGGNVLQTLHILGCTVKGLQRENCRCSNHSINCKYANLQVINFAIYYALFFQRFLAPTIVLATASVYQLLLEINCTIVSTIFFSNGLKTSTATVYTVHQSRNVN
jgi:hypothetical protein